MCVCDDGVRNDSIAKVTKRTVAFLLFGQHVHHTGCHRQCSCDPCLHPAGCTKSNG